MVSSTISILASLTLLFMILRSNQKLRSTLHRLLLGLCISDLISSFAMSFASTLSPPDHVLGWNTFGNMTLCRTQGFLHIVGHMASPLYNCSLCVYYLIEIKYTNLVVHMRRIEICMHATSILIAFAFGTASLFLDTIKPSPTNCMAGETYPFECRFNPEVECEGGVQYGEHMLFSVVYIFIQFIFVPVTVFVSMTMIYREVASQEVRMNQYRFSFTRRGSTSAHRNTTAARNRAAAYSLAWLLSWSTLIIIGIMRLFITDHDVDLCPFGIALMHYVLFPLQGLFNVFAYICSKVMARMYHYEREGVANPLRFLLSLRDIVISKGRASATSRPANSAITFRRSTSSRSTRRLDEGEDGTL